METKEIKMTSQVPYLIRAVYEWIVDNNQTPYLTVSARVVGVQVPEAYVKDGHITLNVSPRAVNNFHIGNEAISFAGRFNGLEMLVYIPIDAVRVVYGNESSQGLILPPSPARENSAAPSEIPVVDKTTTTTKRPSFLKVVK